jgi:hypothetical protein
LTPADAAKAAAKCYDENVILNKQFNRLESLVDHFYWSNLECEAIEHHITKGWIKCKLLHGYGYSVIIPDQLLLDQGGLKWIQPIGFTPNLIAKFSELNIVCDLRVYISCGQALRVRFVNSDLVRDLPDGSQLYRCELIGPMDLHEYAVGEAEFSSDNVPYVHLYHHTTKDACQKILAGAYFRTSSSNIQGTTKKFRNVAYVYFTPLDAIQTDSDLKMIAMAQGGKLELLRDGFVPPDILMPNYLETFKDDILQLVLLHQKTAAPVSRE